MPNLQIGPSSVPLTPDSVSVQLDVVDLTGAGLSSDHAFTPFCRGFRFVCVTGGEVVVRAKDNTADSSLLFLTGETGFLPGVLTAVRATGASTFRGQIVGFL